MIPALVDEIHLDTILKFGDTELVVSGRFDLELKLGIVSVFSSTPSSRITPEIKQKVKDFFAHQREGYRIIIDYVGAKEPAYVP